MESHQWTRVRRVVRGDGAETVEPLEVCPVCGGKGHLPARPGKHTRAVSDRDAADTPLGLVMPTDVLCVGADTSVEAVARLFLERRIGGAPVVDDAGRLLGIVTKTDLVREHQELEGWTRLTSGPA